MDFALARPKNPGATWRKVQTARRKNQKPPRVRKHKTARVNPPDLAPYFKTAAETFARGVLALATCYVLMHAWFYLTTTGHFEVSSVEFEGNRKIKQGALLNWAPPLIGQNILLLDMEDIAKRLNAHPWVSNVSVQRKWPNTVLAQIRERKPFARVQMEQIFIIDNFGVVLGEEEPAFQRLPLITGKAIPDLKPGDTLEVEGLLEGLRTLHGLNQLDFFSSDPVYAVHLSGPRQLTFTTRDRGLKIHVAANAVREGFRNFQIILDALESNGTEMEYIDLSFKDKVIIKPIEGASRQRKT